MNVHILHPLKLFGNSAPVVNRLIIVSDLESLDYL